MRRLIWVWDYDIDESLFREILAGNVQVGRLDRRWAAVRLLEYGPYREIIKLLGYSGLVRNWPEWRKHIRSVSRRRGFDFLAEWISRRHPELL
jgi:hypothetical protein